MKKRKTIKSEKKNKKMGQVSVRNLKGLTPVRWVRKPAVGGSEIDR
jgi:hypothetical protein